MDPMSNIAKTECTEAESIKIHNQVDTLKEGQTIDFNNNYIENESIKHDE